MTEMKEPIMILLPHPTDEETQVMQKIISEAKDTDTFKDRLFIVMDTDLSKLFSSETMLKYLAYQIKLNKELHNNKDKT